MRNKRHAGISLVALTLTNNFYGSYPLTHVKRYAGTHDTRGRAFGNSPLLRNKQSEVRERPAYRLKRERCTLLNTLHANENDIAHQEEKRRLKLQKRTERIAKRTRSLQKLFPRFDASRMATKAPILLSANSQRKIPAKLDALKSELPEVDVERLVRLSPDLLNYNVHEVLGPRIQELRRVFPDFTKIVMLWPGILTHDVKTFTLRKMEELSELLPGVDILRLISRHPMMLCLDVQGNVKPRLERLAQLLPGQNVTAMVGKVPRLLACDLGKVEQKVSSLRWLLGPEANLNKILRSNPDLLVSNVETTVAAKFRHLQEIFTEANVVSMVERDSKLLFYDVEKSVKVKVDCWRERVTNVTELDAMIAAHPAILSNSLDVSVSRLDFLIETNATEVSAAELFKVVKTRRQEWAAAHGESYRYFLEQKVSGPPVLRLWPGLYFDSDPNTNRTGDPREDNGAPLKATIEGDRVEVLGERVKGPRPVTDAHIKALEKKYGSIIKEAQLRFSSALGHGKRGAVPTEMDMVLYDIKKFDQQVRKLAMARRLERFSELLPELNTDRLFTDFPNIVLMDLKKVEERVQDLRELFQGGDVCGAVSSAPQLLLHDVQLCLRPRMMRLIVALTVNQLEGALDASMVRNMVVRCPQLLLTDVRNVVVPSLQYVLRSTSEHYDLSKTLYKDPSLLLVGVAPLARLQYSLEQYRRGATIVPLGKSGSTYYLPANESVQSIPGDQDVSAPRCNSTELVESASDVEQPHGVDQSRLLPPLVIPQILKCGMRDFVDRNPDYLSFLAERQGLSIEDTRLGGAVHSKNVSAAPGLGADAQGSKGGVSPGTGRTDRISTDELSQVAFWERAVGARLSEMFRPVDSPYARQTLRAKQEGLHGQKVVLTELDLLIGDVLYFNDRMRILLKNQMRWMPQTLDVGQEAIKLAEDVEWGSRQIMRLLGLSTRAQEVDIPPSAGGAAGVSVRSAEPGSSETLSEGESSTIGEARQNGRGRLSWVSGAIENFRAFAAGSASDDAGVLDEESRLIGTGRRGRRKGEGDARGSAGDEGPDGAEPRDRGKGRLETTSELERLLEEVSSFEGRLEGLLAFRNARIGRGGGEAAAVVDGAGDEPSGEAPDLRSLGEDFTDDSDA